MNKLILILTFMLAFSLNSTSQEMDSLAFLDKNFKFEDGLYDSFLDFKQDNPSLIWAELKSSLYTNPISMQTYIDFAQLSSGEKVDLDQIWGICLGGIPYININKKTAEGLAIFSGIKVRGHICLFSFENLELIEKEMFAYNPLTGQPFRKAKISREKIVEQDVMLHFNTGEISVFNKVNLLDWIKDDQQLYQSVSKLDKEDEEKLFKSLLIYCDRNPVKVGIDK